MATNTPNLNLSKPQVTDKITDTIPALATNFSTIDSTVGNPSTLTTSDKSSLVNAINANQNQIGNLSVFINANAYSTIQQALNQIATNGGRVYVPIGTISSSQNITLFSKNKLEGTKGSIINNNANVLNLSGDDITIDGVEIDSTNLTTITATQMVNRNTIKNSKITSNQIALNFANGVTELHLEKNDINASNYGILVNENGVVFGSENVKLLYNIITVNDGDCIEINVPYNSSNLSQVLRGVLIQGNYLKVNDTGHTITNAGFAIGIAKAQDVQIIGNTIEVTKLEAIHIEDCTGLLVIKGNIANNCNNHGITLSYNNANGIDSKPPIVNQNSFKFTNNSKTANMYGIYLIDNGGGNYPAIDISHNTVEGFDTGLMTFDYNNNVAGSDLLKPVRNVDGLVIKDCNVGVHAQGIFKGNVTCYNTPVLVNLSPDSRMESIGSATPLAGTNMIQMSTGDGAGVATIEKFFFPVLANLGAAVTTTVDIINLPFYFKGTFEVDVEYGGTKGYALIDVVYNGTSLTTNTVDVSNYSGDLSAIALAIDGTKLAVQVYSGAAKTNAKINISFNGSWVLKN